MKKIFAVVGVLINPEGKLLVAERPEHTISAGKWEFPGGKIESFENASDALKRELYEELGVLVVDTTHLLNFSNSFSDREVQINVYLVNNWQNEPYGAEGQKVRWVSTCEILELDFLPGLGEILNAIRSV